MRYVDLQFHTPPVPGDWTTLQNATFVCSICQIDLAASRGDLVCFDELDHFFHQHTNDLFCRAIQRIKNGLQLGLGDSPSQFVLQNMMIVVNGRGDFTPGFKSVADLRTASKEFYEAMKQRGLILQSPTSDSLR